VTLLAGEVATARSGDQRTMPYTDNPGQVISGRVRWNMRLSEGQRDPQQNHGFGMRRRIFCAWHFLAFQRFLLQRISSGTSV
jgi:hypothetical protein